MTHKPSKIRLKSHQRRKNTRKLKKPKWKKEKNVTKKMLMKIMTSKKNKNNKLNKAHLLTKSTPKTKKIQASKWYTIVSPEAENRKNRSERIRTTTNLRIFCKNKRRKSIWKRSRSTWITFLKSKTIWIKRIRKVYHPGLRQLVKFRTWGVPNQQ